MDPPRNLSKGVFVGMASLLREPEGARPESCGRAGKAVAGAVAEASVGVNPTAPRICSGVPGCSSGLWVPGSSGLRVLDMSSGAPGGLSKARFLEQRRTQTEGGGRRRAERAPGHRRRRPLPQGPGLRAFPQRRSLPVLARQGAHRSPVFNLCLFFLSHPQPGALCPHPTRQMGRQGCGEGGGSEGLAPGSPPFALPLPLVLPTPSRACSAIRALLLFLILPP